jgi:hypothetical protein
MNTSNNTQITPKTHADRRNTVAAGIILIAAGAGLLFFQKFELFQYFMLVLGLGMTLLGILTRTAGWMIPGGIVGGIGLGIALLESPLTGTQPSVDEGGLFLMCMAAGFASITLFTKLFAGESHPWALIPAGVMAFIGGMVLLDEPGLKVLEVVGSYWPVTLILVGGYILYKVVRGKPE